MTCWADAIATATEHTPTPSPRALVSDDGAVWLVAPQWEGVNIRALVCVADAISGPIVVRDIDRHLLTYTVQIPRRASAAAGWIEAGHLLIPAT